MAYENINKSYDAGIAPGIIEYHEKRLLKNFFPKATWARDVQVRPLPRGNGKRAQFRKMVPFEPSTKPLEEGVTKKGQKLSQTEMWVTLKPYGEHVEFTDEFDLYHLDNLHQEINTLLGEQARQSLDILARDAKCAGTNVMYAGGRASRANLTAADKLTYDIVRRAVRTLEKNLAPKFSDGYYHANIDPDTKYDLMKDPMWIDVAKYQDKSQIEKNEIGIIAGVKFFETTVSKDYTPDTYIAFTDSTRDEATAGIAKLTVASYDATTLTVVVSETLSEYAARCLDMKMVEIDGDQAFIEYADAATKTLKLRYAPASTPTLGDYVTPESAGPVGVSIRATVIYGRDFCGGISLDGSGQNVRVIIKPLGSSGSDDPYDQRGTIAYKIKGVGYHILQDAFGVRIEHAVSA